MDRFLFKATSVENDTFHLNPPFGSKSCSEELSINTDHLPSTSTLTSLLDDLLQTEDACFGDSSFTTNAALDKLLLFKVHIAKELETTEYEIDLFDNELVSLKVDQESVQRRSSYIAQDDSDDPISCLVSPEGSLKMSLNFTPVHSLTISGSKESVMESSSSREPDLQFKNADDSILLVQKSNIGESGSLGKEMPCISTMNSTGCVSDGEDIFGVQHPTANDVVERMTNENDSRDGNILDASTSGASYSENVNSHGRDSNDFMASIMASNKDAAKQASQLLDKSLPIQRFDPWESGQILSCRKNDLHVKEKLALRKDQLKIKERVLTLKFRVFHRLWKEDLQLLSVKKQGLKSQKRFKLHNQSSQSGPQKHRSIQSAFTLPAGNLTLVPTADLVNYTSKLSDSHIKMFRSNLKMPAFIVDEKERNSRFITNNNLLEDPMSFEKERTMINPWTQEERRVFMEMLATFGKDFGKISSFLSHKTTADCVEFYYKNHKSESFSDVKKHLDFRKQQQCLSTNSYMVTTGKQLNHGANAASLDMPGAVSVTAAHKKGHRRNRQKYARRTVLPNYHSLKVSCASYGFSERVNSVAISASDKETTAADVLAGLCGTLSSEAVSSCVTSSVNSVMLDRPLAQGITQIIEEEDDCSDEDHDKLFYSVDWTDEEKSEFIRALSMYGKDFANVSNRVGTKSRDQCKIFFSKARKCLGLDMIQPAAGNVEAPISDANGGSSDVNDSTQCCSKMGVVNSICEASVHAGTSSSQPETGRSSEQYAHRESYNNEVDLKSALKVEKLRTEGANLQVSSIQEEVDDNSLSCNSDEFSEDAKSVKVEEVHLCSPAEQTMTRTKNEQLTPQSSVNILQKDARSSPANVVKSEVDLQQQVLLASEIWSADICQKKIVVESDANTAGKRTNDFQQSEPPESISCLRKKPRLASSDDPSSIYSEGSLGVALHSTITFEGHRNKLRKVSAASDFSQQPLLGNQSVNQIDDVLDDSLVSSSRSVMSFPAASEKQSNSQLRSCLEYACDEDKEQSIHVKLFGQILSNPSPSQKKSISSPKLKKSATVKPCADNISSVNEKRLAELEKRNGFDIASGFQRQGGNAMARLHVKTASGAGVLDPVAVILAATGRPALLVGETEQLRTDFGGS